ncbi:MULTISPECIES: TAXI family TRAP transporter solute-binding subunit [unclassified Rhodococcus (in: high G+C Gram-positive bacteria)]|uniref:TAXI family TRAP transporter solute-binding subunit n=1 Tax=unclassified Rhodococcus (in: high G+C Gram-positive bacteria) TaxID=192944 RepID=UPI000701BA08|nr:MULTISPECIES: TAXI family TRAP transporter solute-binding subunit [unclassified Rhodococcus (in: high G+C Gram-positive bacteria)]MDQ1202614.1 TRAP transporter TAXI family solute receptor [Rhodococcus sp. SORGH_AS_0303]
MLGRRQFLRGAGVAAAAAALAGCSRDTWWQDASGRLRIATGNVGAVFDEYGAALRTEASQVLPGVRSEVLVTGGSVGNVLDLSSSSADVAFCLGDTALDAVRGEGAFDSPVPLTALARLYDSFLQILVPVYSPVTGIQDLAGVRLSAGQTDSGTRSVTERCLAAAGVDTADVDFVAQPLGEATAALSSGRVDALAFVSGFPVRALVELGARTPIRALDLGGLVEGLVSTWGPQYVTGPLPAGPYRLPAAVQTVSVKTYLIATPTLREDTAYGFTSVVFDRQDAIARTVPDVRQPTVAAGMFTQPVPLHPGALRWFRDRDAREVR